MIFIIGAGRSCAKATNEQGAWISHMDRGFFTGPYTRILSPFQEPTSKEMPGMTLGT